MKLGFIFPGQGAQSVGMGKDLYEKYEEVKKVYDEASKIAGVDIAKIYDVIPNHISAWIAKAKHELMINETFIKEISCNF